MDEIRVAEVAAALGVSRQRIYARIASGDLAFTDRIGLLTRPTPARVSRPLSSMNAWRLIFSLTSLAILDTHPTEVARLTARLHKLTEADAPETLLHSWLSSRGSHVDVSLPTADLERFASDPRVRTRGSTWIPQQSWPDLIAYTHADHLPALVADFRPSFRDQPNLRLYSSESSAVFAATVPQGLELADLADLAVEGDAGAAGVLRERIARLPAAPYIWRNANWKAANRANTSDRPDGLRPRADPSTRRRRDR